MITRKQAYWRLGLILMFEMELYSEPWFHAKLLLVIAMSALHGGLSRWRRDFERDENRHSARFYRVTNEVPTVLMIAIVVLVIVRPF